MKIWWFVGSIILIVLLSCLIVGIFKFVIPHQDSNELSNSDEETDGQTGQDELTQINISGVNLTELSEEDIEQICLSESKKIAEDQGYGAAVISDCNCAGAINTIAISYDCMIATTIPFYSSVPVTIYCIKDVNACNITAMGQTYDYDLNG